MAGEVIAVDMDEVLYSWERTARYLLRNVYPGDDVLWDLNEPFREWSVPAQIGDEPYRWLFDEGVEAGLFRHGHVITGAMLGVRALKAAGYKLIVVTHRPENGVQDTLAWIDFHFGAERFGPYPWSGLHILSGGEPKTSVKWDLLIDDSPANAKVARREGRKSILFGAAWNGSYFNWDDVKEMLCVR